MSLLQKCMECRGNFRRKFVDLLCSSHCRDNVMVVLITHALIARFRIERVVRGPGQLDTQPIRDYVTRSIWWNIGFESLLSRVHKKPAGEYSGYTLMRAHIIEP